MTITTGEEKALVGNEARGFRAPWPSPLSAWSDPPWILSGRVATAWFMIERARLAQFLSPDLMPRGDAGEVPARVRFYDVRFHDEHEPRRSVGRFREAVVAFASSAGSTDGEVSLFMWTDDDTYMLWGREIFGWPLERATVILSGKLWRDEPLPASGSAGSSTARCATGELGLRIDEVSPAAAASGPTPIWITPRRVLRRAGLDGDTREVLLVRPEIVDRGRRYEARGSAWITFLPGHPLAGLDVATPTFEVVDGICIRVGGDVDVIAEPTGEGTRR
jgi:hypothetical protein